MRGQPIIPVGRYTLWRQKNPDRYGIYDLTGASCHLSDRRALPKKLVLDARLQENGNGRKGNNRCLMLDKTYKSLEQRQ
jgi:hypothetical protein